MHDNVSGLLALERKEELLKLIAEQQERGEDGLEEEDRWLLEVNLDDLETIQTVVFPQQSEWRKDRRGIPNVTRLSAPSAARTQARSHQSIRSG